MRVRPDGYRSGLAVQWLCAAADLLLGEADLSCMPALMSGYGSIVDHTRISAFAPAAFALRQLGVSVASDIQLRQAVADAASWEEEHRDDPDFEEPPYEIDAERPDFPFRRRAGTERIVAGMNAALVKGLPLGEWSTSVADPARSMVIMEAAAEGAARIGIDLSEVPPLPRSTPHDLSRVPRGPIVVTLSELEKVAHELDRRDAMDARRQKGNWASRLREENGERKFHVLAPDRANGILEERDVIRLEGLKHLIGLPGTGKTTLIVLLLVWLDRNGYRTVVLLPSIEASLNMLGDLRFYDVDVGLLVGQSPETRIEHARKFAERLGADENGGFGRTAPGADLLALNCALAAFDSDPEGNDGFPHLQPPCRSVLQHALRADGTPARKETSHLCPLGGWCGRLKAPRELATKRIWLGHVLSMDTRIGPHFVDEKVRYFEAVAMSADLVVVDEADGAQAVLDRKAISSLDLTGSKESFEHALHKDLFLPISAGRNDLTTASLQSYSATAADFAKLNRSLVAQIQRSLKRNSIEGPIARFRDTFVTGNNVLTALFCPDDITSLPGDERLVEEQRFGAIQTFWDGCVRTALFRRTDIARDPDDDMDGVRVADGLGKTEDEVDTARGSLVALLRDWISEPLPSRQDTILGEARELTFRFLPPLGTLGPEDRVELFRFLVGVTTVIFQFVALVPAQQAMAAEGVHHSPLFRQGVSEDLARTLPEALIGRLSGIRYQHEESGAGRSVRLQYVAFRGTPRVLLYRLHHLLRHENRPHGPAVLLASATSFLKESPTFHVPVGPDLVLRRAGADAGWHESEYVFAPVTDPDRPSGRLRFSGAPLARRSRILRQMLDHWFAGEDPLALRACRDFDAGRKIGFVVNSYEQVRQAKEHLGRTRPGLAHRVIGVIDRIPVSEHGDWITAAQVERLGMRDDWDALVFPMKALSRGVNIVFEHGLRRRDALLGVLAFLIRPHPATESLDLVAGLAGSRTLAFETGRFDPAARPQQMSAAWRKARRDLMATTRSLLRFPVQASRLGALAEPFTADIMVDVLQTIGRAMRNGCKARVVFVDAAWAPRSAAGGRESADSSMLVGMRDILRKRLGDPDPVDREIYRALYEPFLRPLERCEGVRFPDGADRDD